LAQTKSVVEIAEKDRSAADPGESMFVSSAFDRGERRFYFLLQ